MSIGPIQEDEAPPPGTMWQLEAQAHGQDLAIVDTTPRDIEVQYTVGETGTAVCPHCETVVSKQQAVVTGPLLEPDESYDFRPVFLHECKQARSTVHLYADLGD